MPQPSSRTRRPDRRSVISNATRAAAITWAAGHKTTPYGSPQVYDLHPGHAKRYKSSSSLDSLWFSMVFYDTLQILQHLLFQRLVSAAF